MSQKETTGVRADGTDTREHGEHRGPGAERSEHAF